MYGLQVKTYQVSLDVVAISVTVNNDEREVFCLTRTSDTPEYSDFGATALVLFTEMASQNANRRKAFPLESILVEFKNRYG
jgi:hypothetical protein